MILRQIAWFYLIVNEPTVYSKVSVRTFEIVYINANDPAIRQCEVIGAVPRPSSQQTSRFILKQINK